MRILSLILFAAACHPLPPPPVFAPHAGTQPQEQGAITAMVVIGAVTEVMGGEGWGIALRVERQQTARTTIGGELTGGRGGGGEYEDGTTFEQALVGIRAYGRTSPSNTDELAMSYGAGLSWMRTGLVTATLSTSFMASRPSDTVVPLAALSFALAIPLRHGRAYGDRPLNLNFGEPMAAVTPDPIIRDGKLILPTEPLRHRVPKLDFYIGLDVGFIVSLGDTGNALSIDIGGAVPVRARKLLLSASAADAQTL